MPLQMGMVMTSGKTNHRKPIVRQPIQSNNRSNNQVNYKPHMKIGTISMNNRYTMSGMYNSNYASYG